MYMLILTCYEDKEKNSICYIISFMYYLYT
jgi:hypothetical protein